MRRLLSSFAGIGVLCIALAAEGQAQSQPKLTYPGYVVVKLFACNLA